MLLRLIPVLALFGLGLSCGIPPMDAVRDLAAIHSETDWRPVSPATLSVSPDYYFGEVSAVVDGSALYDIQDHQALELAILERIAAVDYSDPAHAIEIASWMLIELSQDDYSPARVEAAKTIAHLAGNWILSEGARLLPQTPDTNLTTAIVDFDQATTVAEFQFSLGRIGRATIPDTITGIRILTAIGRKANEFGFSSGAGQEVIFSTALGILLQGLEEGSQAQDSSVAEICQHWHDLLLPRAVEQTTEVRAR